MVHLLRTRCGNMVRFVRYNWYDTAPFMKYGTVPLGHVDDVWYGSTVQYGTVRQNDSDSDSTALCTSLSTYVPNRDASQ